MTLFLLIVFGCYILAVIALTFGWARTTDKPAREAANHRQVAVIVPFRDEAATLPTLVQDLQALNYPHDKVTFVLVDDHSSDGSSDAVRGMISDDHRFHLLRLEYGMAGKKSAIAKAINQIEADVIVTTDADCRVETGWLNAVNSAFSLTQARMVVGPVRLTGDSFFAKLQSIEFCSLVGTAGASLSFGVPVLCNGANLAFLRQSFLDVGGFRDNETITSGDDDFLMKKFAATWKGCVTFMSNPEGIVSASAATDAGKFASQRLRWAGKWKLAFNAQSLLAVAVLFFHACNILLFAGWLAGAISPKWFAVMAGGKFFVEMIFLFPVSKFLGVRWSWISFFVLQLFHSFYVVSIGFLSQILTARWKGREVVTRVWTGIS